MKYVVLIHSHPKPWGHPTIDFTTEGRAVPAEERAASGEAFDAFLAEVSRRGELIFAEALASPGEATFYRDGTTITDGPYAESVEQLAGLFVFDVESRERAEEIAREFAGPGDVVELRPAYVWPETP